MRYVHSKATAAALQITIGWQNPNNQPLNPLLLQGQPSHDAAKTSATYQQLLQ
jgi:hypothetical protein